MHGENHAWLDWIWPTEGVYEAKKESQNVQLHIKVGKPKACVNVCFGE